jgi:hypothetical protein
MAFQALFLELFLITTLTLVGVELLVLLKVPHRQQNILYFAPALGLSAIVMIIFFFNRLGIPVSLISKVLFPAIYIFLIIKFTSIRKMISKQFIKVSLVTILGLQLTFWPLIKYGLKWISYANDDMTNYVLGAQRFYSHGFFDKIDFSKFLAGSEYSAAFYSMHVSSGVRPGSDLLLAFNSLLTSGDTLKIFMVTIASLQFVIAISIVGLLITTQGISAKKTYLMCTIIAITPLISLGSLYQLIGQVGGIGLSIGLYALSILAVNEKGIVQKKLCIAFVLVFAGLIIWYPEILPFTLLPISIIIIHAWRSEILHKSQILHFAMFTSIVLVITLNKYLLNALLFLMKQSSNASSIKGSETIQTMTFPYYLIPNGLPSTLGLTPFYKIAGEPLGSALVLTAILLIFVLTISLPKLVALNWQTTVPLITYMFAAAFLFYQKSDFGLFKIVMFLAPWLAISVFNYYVSLFKRNLNRPKSLVARVSILPLAGLLIFTQFVYSNASVYGKGGLQEIPDATRNDLIGNIENALATYKPYMGDLTIDTPNLPTAKILMSMGKGTPMFFPSRDYIAGIIRFSPAKFPELSERSKTFSIPTRFGINSFEIPAQQIGRLESESSYVLTQNGGDSIFNRSLPNREVGFKIVKDPENFLIFKDSSLGPHYYLVADKAKVGVWQLEKDPMMPTSEMSALGQVVLMQALNPTPASRLSLEISSTVLEQNSRVLPRAEISGEINSVFDIVGRGSARALSTVVNPFEVAGLKFLQLNFLNEGRYFKNTKGGLNGLYNKQITLDPRKIVTFGKAINLTNRSEVLFDAPERIGSFPKDLENEELLYSGIYETGWLSEDSYFYLKSSGRNNSLKLTGFVPLVKNKDFVTNIEITIDGKQVAKRNLQVGDFEFNLNALSIKPGVHRVGIRFDKFQNIQGKQELYATSFLRQLGFFPKS